MNDVTKVRDLQESEAKSQLILVLNLLFDSQTEDRSEDLVDVEDFGVLAHNLSSGPMIMTKIPNRLDVFFLLRGNKVTINKPNTGTNMP